MVNAAIDTAIGQPLYASMNELETDFLFSDRRLNKLDLLHCAMKSQTIGQCFALAYRCALQALLPTLDRTQWAALCVSEDAGNHPKLIATTCTELGTLTGKKSFVSMADRATQFIVIAKLAETSSELKAVLLNAPQQGATVNVLPALSFIPDIDHGELVLTDAQGIVLAGDGHADYSRVFRFLEDSHILLACSSMMLSHALRFKLPIGLLKKLLLLVHGCRFLNQDQGVAADLVLAELFAEFEKNIDAFEQCFDLLPENFSQAWLRDKKLFSIASKARIARTEKAQTAMLNSVKA